MKSRHLLLILLVLTACCCGRRDTLPPLTRPIPAPDYVGIDSNGFTLNGTPWFPVMLNYKAFYAEGEVVPAPWYTGSDVGSHFDTIAAWGFNAVRVCLDVLDEQEDTSAMFAATRRLVQRADSAGLRVMLLVKPPFDDYWRTYAAGLMQHLSDLPALWAYDLMNEPLYFDPVDKRDKQEAIALSRSWQQLVRHNAPHQLFTIATAEPIEVFEWDPSMLAVDFIEMHTYHPLRVQSEMWWYAHYCRKPWMVGETGLPADDDRVPYAAQAAFMAETYGYALQQGAIGYGWWEFQDCPTGVNFEAQYTGLRDAQGNRKPAASIVQKLHRPSSAQAEHRSAPPANYYNMLAYQNVAVVGRVVDSRGEPIEGAVVRGWNADWSIGMNTYSDSTGRFRLVSNDICTHYEISAAGRTKVKMDKSPSFPPHTALPDRSREYQQLPLLGWGDSSHILPTDVHRFAAQAVLKASLGNIVLKPLK
ncbi:MAG: carboxypeptidase regulatory-like domain-containing protein [Bacteroidales bacterium]|nr:carboxypeptidase regulatory-like domain-containing protein [Bacteroidales bacterium]